MYFEDFFAMDEATLEKTLEYVTFPTQVDFKLDTVLKLGIIAAEIRAISLQDVVEYITQIYYEDYIDNKDN